MLDKKIVLLILLFISLTPQIYSMDQMIGLKIYRTDSELVIENYFGKITIDLEHGGIVKDYTYQNINLSNRRYFYAGGVLNTIYYEISPPPLPVGSSAPLTGWGSIMTNKAMYRIVEKTPYKLVFELEISLSRVYNVSLIKRYTFYYDKMFFDLEYVFINNANTDLAIDLTSELGRSTGFFIEISSCYGGDAQDDLQIIGFTNKSINVYTGEAWSNPYITPGGVRFIALISSTGDLPNTFGIILIPRDNNTINGVNAVNLDISGKNVPNAPVSSIVRLEMKPLIIEKSSSINYYFRVYIGLLSLLTLQDIGLEDLANLLRSRQLLIPDRPEGYAVRGQYQLTISIMGVEKETQLPNATIYIYYLNDNYELTQIAEVKPSKTTISITVNKTGIYVVKVEPEQGFTIDKMNIFEGVTINNNRSSTAYIPVYENTMVNLKFDIKPIGWITLTIVDQNYYMMSGINETNSITIEVKGVNFTKQYSLTTPEFKTYLQPGDYTIVVPYTLLGNMKLTDVFYNQRIKIFGIEGDKAYINIHVDPYSDNILVFRYSSTGFGGLTASPMLIYGFIAGFILVMALLVYILLTFRRRRRI